MKNAIVLVCILGIAVCDVPVHCIRTSVVGLWEITLNKETMQKDITNPSIACGHTLPNSYIKLKKGVFPKYKSSIKLDLSLITPNIAKLLDKEGNIIEEGSWTLLYDEGFYIKLPSYELFAEFKYIGSGLKDFESESICGETQTGWYFETESDHMGCFYGQLIKTTETKFSDACILSRNEADELKESYPTQECLEKALTNIVDKINKNQNWVANFSAEHFKVFEDISIKNIKKNKSKKVFFSMDAMSNYSSHLMADILEGYKDEIDKDNKFYKRYITPIEEFKDSDLPEEFDWRNVDGEDYTSPIRKQGACGSCYTVSTIEAFEARLRIITDKKFDKLLNIQELLSCSMFSEGCTGGFPFSSMIYLKQFGVHSEECYNYLANDSISCQEIEVSCKSLPLYKIKEFGYLKSYYSNIDEKSIMKELYLRGPLPISFYSDIMRLYTEGIFDCQAETLDLFTEEEMYLLRKLFNNFDPVNHAVVVVGWGHNDEGDYWILQNSWGEEFGDKGFFKMRRGTNECGIETMIEVLLPEIPQLTN